MQNREHSGSKERSEKFDIDNVRLENLAKGRRIRREQILSGKITRKNPMERFMDTDVPITSLKYYKLAVAANCFDCNGGEEYITRTRECPVVKCAFFWVRPYQEKKEEKSAVTSPAQNKKEQII